MPENELSHNRHKTMKPNPSSASPQTSRSPSLVLASLAFGLGIALTGIWFHQRQVSVPNQQLSDATKNLLGHLQTPVTIHYYALLPAGSTDESLSAFAGRVTQLLDTMQIASGGKIQLASLTAPAETNATAATGDGLQPFNLNKGDACFLGLAISSGKNHETFAQLQPEWEGALEYDLARAIQRVAVVTAPSQPAPEPAKPSSEIVATVNRLIPDASAVSVEQADQIFHAEFIKRCQEVGAESETELHVAQQKAVDVQASGSPAEQAAAQKNLMQVQLAQGEKFKSLASDLQTQLTIFQQMKAGNAAAK